MLLVSELVAPIHQPDIRTTKHIELLHGIDEQDELHATDINFVDRDVLEVLNDIVHECLNFIGECLSQQRASDDGCIGVLIGDGFLVEIDFGVHEPLVLQLLKQAHVGRPVASVDVVTITLAGNEVL